MGTLGWLLAAVARADEPIVIPQFQPAVPPGSGTTPAAPVGAASPAGVSGASAPAGAAGFQSAPLAAHSDDPSPAVWHQRHDPFFRKNWGIEVLGVSTLSSGWMLQFKYRILDAGKAALLNEKRSKAFVIDEVTDIRLSVPAMENIGELRQTPRPEEGRTYYILFGNPGRVVKPGARVDVLVGRFRADGVIVE